MQEDDSVPKESESPSQMRAEHHRDAESFPSGQLARRGEPRPVVQANSNCFACGRQNSSGLHLTFEYGPKGVEATWFPSEACESFQGTVHGGIIATVLDEAMSNAIMTRGWQAFTVSLNIRFHSRTCPGERLAVHGWIVERRKRRILTEASLFTDRSIERAHAWATFLMPGKMPAHGAK